MSACSRRSRRGDDAAADAGQDRTAAGDGIPAEPRRDNLFWLARYMERAEQTLRLLRALGDQVGSGETMSTEV